MIDVSRRGLLGMLAAGVGAAIVRPGLLMPVKVWMPPIETSIEMDFCTGNLMLKAYARLRHARLTYGLGCVVTTQGRGPSQMRALMPEILAEHEPRLIKAMQQAIRVGDRTYRIA